MSRITTAEFIAAMIIGAFLAGCFGVFLDDLELLNDPHATIRSVS
jgi:hypothetical protein